MDREKHPRFFAATHRKVAEESPVGPTNHRNNVEIEERELEESFSETYTSDESTSEESENEDAGTISEDAMSWILPWEHIEIPTTSSVLGEGSFGIVYKGSYLGTDVAVKKLYAPPDSQIDLTKYVEREVAVLRSLRHPNIVQLIGLSTHEGALYVITDFMRRGNLRSLLKDDTQRVPWTLRISFALDIASALIYMHSKGILHRDIKSKNLLITESNKIKLCDFGFARSCEKDKNRLTICGTDAWMAPEVVIGNSYGTKADIFSFGVVLIEIMTRVNGTRLNRLMSSGFSLDWQQISQWIGKDIPLRFVALAKKCTETNPSARQDLDRAYQELKEIQKEVIADSQRRMSYDLGYEDDAVSNLFKEVKRFQKQNLCNNQVKNQDKSSPMIHSLTQLLIDIQDFDRLKLKSTNRNPDWKSPENAGRVKDMLLAKILEENSSLKQEVQNMKKEITRLRSLNLELQNLQK